MEREKDGRRWRIGGSVTCATARGRCPTCSPADRSWLVSALWDDGWTCIGGPEALIDRLERSAPVNARRVGRDEDMLPPGLTREG